MQSDSQSSARINGIFQRGKKLNPAPKYSRWVKALITSQSLSHGYRQLPRLVAFMPRRRCCTHPRTLADQSRIHVSSHFPRRITVGLSSENFNGMQSLGYF